MVSLEGEAVEQEKILMPPTSYPTEISPPPDSQKWYCPDSTQRLQYLLKNPAPFL